MTSWQPTVTVLDTATMLPMYSATCTVSFSAKALGGATFRATSSGPAPPYPIIVLVFLMSTSVALIVVPLTVADAWPGQIGPTRVGGLSWPTAVAGGDLALVAQST